MSAPPDLVRSSAEGVMRLPFAAWHFGDSIAFEALVEASVRTGDDRYIAFVRGFGRAWSAGRTAFVPLDCTAAGTALTRTAVLTGDDRLLEDVLRLARYLVGRRTIGGVYRTWDVSPLREPYGGAPMSSVDRSLLSDPGSGVFVDCLHFDPPFFSALADATGDERWRREAVEQALGYVSLLQDGASGLFHHFFLERTGRPHILGWGRGQGWALLGLLDVIAGLPDGAERDALASSARDLIAAMVQAQRADGHWDAVIGDRASGVETSTAAFMVTGFDRAGRLGIAAGEDVARAAESARRALERDTGADGSLSGVSEAVWASTVPAHYASVPRGVRVPWGDGALLLSLLTKRRAGVPVR